MGQSADAIPFIFTWFAKTVEKQEGRCGRESSGEFSHSVESRSGRCTNHSTLFCEGNLCFVCQALSINKGVAML